VRSGLLALLTLRVAIRFIRRWRLTGLLGKSSESSFAFGKLRYLLGQVTILLNVIMKKMPQPVLVAFLKGYELHISIVRILAPFLEELLSGLPAHDCTAMDIYIDRQRFALFAKNCVQRVKRPGERRAQDSKIGVHRLEVVDYFQSIVELRVIDTTSGFLPNNKNEKRIVSFFARTKNQQSRILFLLSC